MGFLAAEALESGYGEMQVLWGVSLRVERSSITVVLGPNGAGKTTLLKTIMCIVRPWRGSIVVDGVEVTWRPPHEKVGMGVSLVPEGRRLFPELTVEENLFLGAYSRGGDMLWDSLEMVYSVFPRLRERRGQRAGTLSGGEQQMLAIARALMSRPRLLMLDEPSQGLAPKLSIEIMRVLEDLRREGLTILLVEQNVSAALSISDYAYVMEQGRIVAEGDPERIARAEDIRRAYLGV